MRKISRKIVGAGARWLMAHLTHTGARSSAAAIIISSRVSQAVLKDLD
eukprot:COSAG01_NODE_66066_length_271_cov_0.883721_1_plen_47_part_10